MNVNGDFRLNYIDAEGVSGKVAKIFDFDQYCIDDSGSQVDSTFIHMIFRVIHGRNADIEVKDYHINVLPSRIDFVDVSPNSPNKSECFVGKLNGKCGVFFKPSYRWADTTIQVLYCRTPSMFNFNYYGKFDIDTTSITDKQEPTNCLVEKLPISKDLVLQNGWVQYNPSSKCIVTKDRNIVNLDIGVKGGTIDDSTIITILAEEFRPKTNIFIPCCTWNGTKYSNGECVCHISVDGSVKIYNCTTNKRLDIHHTYIV